MRRGRSTAAAFLVLGATVTLTIVLANQRNAGAPKVDLLPGGYADVAAVPQGTLMRLDGDLVITVGEDEVRLRQAGFNARLGAERLFGACVTPDPSREGGQIVWVLGTQDSDPLLERHFLPWSPIPDAMLGTELRLEDERIYTALAPAPPWLAGGNPALLLLDGRQGVLLVVPIANDDSRALLFDQARTVGSHPPDAPRLRGPLAMGFRDPTRMRIWPHEEDLERWTWIVRPLTEARQQARRPLWNFVWEGDPERRAFTWSHATDASYAREGLTGPHLALAPAAGSDEVWIHASGVVRGHFEVMVATSSETTAERVHRPRDTWPPRRPGDRHVVAHLDRVLAAGDRIRIDHVWPDRMRIAGPWTDVVAAHPRPQVRWASGGPIRLRGPALSDATTVSLDLDGAHVEIPWFPVGRETIEIRDERALVEFAETILVLENPGAPGKPTRLVAEVDTGVER